MLLKLISSFFKISVQTICLFLIFWAETTRKHFGRDIVFVIGIKPFLLFSIENNFFCLFVFILPHFFFIIYNNKKRDLTTTAHCTRTPLSLLMTGWPLLVFNFSVTALWLDFFFFLSGGEGEGACVNYCEIQVNHHPESSDIYFPRSSPPPFSLRKWPPSPPHELQLILRLVFNFFLLLF